MLSNIVKGYGKLFAGVSRVIILLAACSAVGAAVVIPLWKFATAAPSVYTALVLFLLFAALAFAAAKKARAAGARATIRFALKALIVCAALAGAVAAVLTGHRLLALLVLLVAVILYGITSFGPGAHEKDA